jgi:hypothetical protein
MGETMLHGSVSCQVFGRAAVVAAAVVVAVGCDLTAVAERMRPFDAAPGPRAPSAAPPPVAARSVASAERLEPVAQRVPVVDAEGSVPAFMPMFERACPYVDYVAVDDVCAHRLVPDDARAELIPLWKRFAAAPIIKHGALANLPPKAFEAPDAVTVIAADGNELVPGGPGSLASTPEQRAHAYRVKQEAERARAESYGQPERPAAGPDPRRPRPPGPDLAKQAAAAARRKQEQEGREWWERERKAQAMLDEMNRRRVCYEHGTSRRIPCR